MASQTTVFYSAAIDRLKHNHTISTLGQGTEKGMCRGEKSSFFSTQIDENSENELMK